MAGPWLSRIGIALAAICLSLPASAAEDWKELRASGALGERFDGLLVARDPSAAAVAEPVNTARRALYAQRARENGTTIDQVGRVYFKENLAALPAGTWLLLEDGTWRQR
jgi:uncharacterized protein YdbL (DUF1318 family)